MESQSSSSDEADIDHGLEQGANVRDPTSADTASSDQQADDSSRRASATSGQKRRRVTRACDECRRKKIKCDGKQPCTHCTVYSYDCTYDQPSNRRRNPAPQYIEALENKLGRAEAIIRMYLPNLDMQDPGLDQMLQQQGTVPIPPRSQFGRTASDKGLGRTTSNDPPLEAMMESAGMLDLDEKGHWEYKGGSSGLSFMRGVRDKLCDLSLAEGTDDESKEDGQPPVGQIRVPSPPPYVGEEPGIGESPYDSANIGTTELPGKELARQLCISALDDATAILKPIHQPSFYYRFDRIYDLPPESYDNDDHAFLPQLYAVIALGCLFATDTRSELELNGYKSAIDVGYKYFWASRQLIDVTDCRDLPSLQAIVFMIMFLQCSAKLATCYSFIGVALRSALRMGMHRSFRNNFSPVEAEIRKRLFWVIRKMDVYVSTMLGLPQTVNDEDIDQDYPVEVDDDHITSDGIVPMPEGTLSLMAATTANFRLSKILCKIVRCIYPIKSCPASEGTSTRSFSISYAKIREIEMDLQRWQESLPSQLQPGEDGAPQNVRQQRLLRMSYAHAQMMLYRPFLHYVSARNQAKPVNQRAYACAAACVSVSRNIIQITADMKKRGLLEGSYWFTMYTTFFGVLSLTFFALENPDSKARQDAVKDAKEGKETLARLARRSMAADRCSSTLKVLFEQIGDSFERSPSPKARSSKRSASSTKEKADKPAPIKTEPATETGKGSSKSFSSTSSTSQRGSAAPRQRGMRLISHTGRPTNQKQNQAQQQTQAQVSPPLPNTTQAQQQQPLNHHPVQHQTLQQLHQPPGIPAANLYASNMANESPSTTSASPPFGTRQHDQYERYIQQQQQQQQQQYPFIPQQPSHFQEPHFTDNISNLSNMMFPSDNPFHYPNQPMTALEQNFGLSRPDVYTSPQQQQQPHQHQHEPQHAQQDMFIQPTNVAYGPRMPPSDEHIDAQPFGPLPAYGPGGAADIGIGIDNPQANMPPSSAALWNHQGLPVMNMDYISADDEWHG